MDVSSSSGLNLDVMPLNCNDGEPAYEPPAYPETFRVPFKQKIMLQEDSHKSPIYAIAFNHFQSADECPVFATAAKNIIHIYNCPLSETAMTCVRAFVDDNADESFFALTWCYDIIDSKHCVIAAGHTGFIKCIDPVSGRLLQEMCGHGDVVNELRTDPNNSMIFASVSKDNTVRIWNIRINANLAVLGGIEGHLDQVLSCDWSPDSDFLVSCGMDHSIRMWHLPESVRVVISQSMTPEGAAEIAKKCAEVTTGDTGTAPIHVNYPNAVTTDLHCDYVDCVRFYGWFVISKGSERVANLFRFGHVDDAVDYIHSVKMDTACTRISVFSLPMCDVWFLKFDVDPLGHWIAFGSSDGHLYFVDMRSKLTVYGDPDFTIQIGNRAIRQVCFGAGGRILIAVTDDYSVWRLDRVENDTFAKRGSSPQKGYSTSKKPKLAV